MDKRAKTKDYKKSTFKKMGDETDISNAVLFLSSQIM